MAHTPFADRFPALAEDLRTSYGEPHRAYHIWAHIEDLLGWYDRLARDWAAPEAVELAIWYHDAVYVPGSKTNEADSADRMTDELTGKVAAPILAQARALILATAEHRLPVAWSADLRNDCGLFLDMDMSILGADRDRYDRYAAAVRKEFAAVPEELYRAGRKAFLDDLLARDAIFLTPRFRASHEAQARTNIAREAASLAAAA